jgi:hypothetical protein
MTAIAEPASDGSIRELIEVTKAQQLLNGVQAQFDSLMSNAMRQELQGKNPTPGQQQAIAKMKDKMVAVMQAELAWAKLEPMYMRLYRESFTEEEVAGMLSFYKTPAGQAVINKTPALMQKTMVEMRKMMSAMSPQMQKILEEFLADMKEASK